MLSRVLSALLLALTFCFIATAQPYGHEWVNYNQTYYKISVAKTGIHRLPFGSLQANGLPATVPHSSIQLWHRGQQIAIKMHSPDNNLFDNNDYIEFFGQHNSGDREAPMWEPGMQPHQYAALYNDSLAYFLTWGLPGTQGKRISQSLITENLTPESHHDAEIVKTFNDEYAIGGGYRSLEQYMHLSSFDRGEGWTGPRRNTGQNQNITFTEVDNLYTGGNAPTLSVLVTGRNYVSTISTHNVEVKAGPDINNLRTLGTVSFSAYRHQLFTSQILYTDVSASGQLVVRVTPRGQNDAISVTYAKLSFKQGFNLAGMQEQRIFNLPVNNANKSALQFQNVPANTFFYDITDVSNVKQIGTTVQGTTHKAVISGTAVPRKVLAATFLSAVYSNQIRKASFRNINPANHDYLMVSYPGMRRPAGGYSNVLKAYASYRASMQGGNHDTLTVDYEMLINQFNYGELSPMAVRRFCKYMLDLGDPKFLILVGKGVSLDLKKNANYYARNHVPPMGVPSSDILFTMTLDPADPYRPALATGRLPASNAQELANFLNKMKEHELVPYNALWRKVALHGSGGRLTNEITRYDRYLKEYATIFEGPLVGGSVRSFGKKTSNAVEVINIAEYVNEGALILNLFGHSSTENADIDVGSSSEPIFGYDNKGKYPLMLINGCNSGDFFNISTESFLEDWAFTPDKGAIGGLAHVALAIDTYLQRYSELFYRYNFADPNYFGKPIGEIMQKQVQQLIAEQSNATDKASRISVAEQVMYLGDPALYFFSPARPDYATQDTYLAMKESNVTVTNPSFKLRLVAENFGKANGDSVAVRLRRTVPGGNSRNYPESYFTSGILYRDTIEIIVDNSDAASFPGLNRFEATIDPDNEIAELNETNNTAVLEYFMSETAVVPLLPRPFSIINKQPVQLVVQASNLMARNKNYIIEWDTTDSFNSTARQTRTISGDAVISTDITLLSDRLVHDSTAYFWRVRTDEDTEDAWQVSSFTYIKNSPEGWTQGHFQEYRDNPTTGVTDNQTNRKWEFPFAQTALKVKVGGQNVSGDSLQITYKNTRLEFSSDFPCASKGVGELLMMYFDKETLEIYPYKLGERTSVGDKPWTYACGRFPLSISRVESKEVSYGSSSIGYTKLLGAINHAASGDYVMVAAYKIGNAVSQWPDSVKNRFADLGVNVNEFAQIQDGEPFIIFGQKGAAPGTATFIYPNSSSADPASEVVSGTFNMSGQATGGIIESPAIGPATNWGMLYHHWTAEPQDSFQLQVLGVRPGLSDTVLKNVPYNGPKAGIDMSDIYVPKYPYIKLRAYLTDNENLSAPQLKRWMVLYTGLPEGTINTSLTAQENFSPEEKHEGEAMNIKMAFQNMSDKYVFADSVKVRMQIRNTTPDGTVSPIKEYVRTYPPMAQGDTLFLSEDITTRGIAGDNLLQVFVNPRLQPEILYENNLISIPFKVKPDNTHPVLDVTFDGQHIMDGELVSPSPLIAILLKDENKFMFKKDTFNMNLFIKKPCDGCDFERVAFSSPQVRWQPADENNRFNIEYNPQGLADGIYTLRVQGTDESGNTSSDVDYSIRFEVVNKSSITNFYPYPNPFSTSMRFVFTLTGSDIPDQIKIQIMTITGRVVREILHDELGPIRIGNNVSTFAWDGTDEYGDRLANGVYLYRVQLRMNGRKVEQRSTAADHTFKNGFGKIYLLR